MAGITYDKVNAECLEIVHEAVEAFHGELHKAGVTIHALFATAEIVEVEAEDGQPAQEIIKPALKVRGYPTLAKISITSLQDRTRGIADAKLVIDRLQWDRMARSRRLALIDHELEHLDLIYDKEGLLKRDDLGRPRMKIKPHDFELTYFDAVAKRHSEASVEYHEITEFQDRYGRQLLLFPQSGRKFRLGAGAPES